MDKPIVFFSHSSRDEKSLRELKKLIEYKTGGAISIFLSSDGQSIPFGRNWVFKVEESLDKSSLMFVFVTLNSLKSNWIYFEAGFSYAREIRVIPIGMGIDLNGVNPPLSLLQGFNLDRVDALGNIIAIINETYETNFDSTFTQDEFDNLFTFDDVQSGIAAINTIAINLKFKPDVKAQELISAMLAENNVEHVISDDAIWSHGIQFYVQINQKVNIVVDGLMVGVYMSILEQLCEMEEFVLGDTGDVYFEAAYVLSSEGYVRQTALVTGTDVKPEVDGQLKYKDFSFRLVDLGNRSPGPIRLDLFLLGKLFNYEWLKEIVNILLDKNVILLKGLN